MKQTSALALLNPAILTLASCAFLSSAREGVKQGSANPNIVFILADDMGYGDVGCFNPESKIPTPNMDKLASQGIRFMNAHSPAALSTPTRYGFLTGRYCWRTRLKEGVLIGYDETPLIETGRPTIASVLKSKGYETAGIGKWHVGLNWPTRDGYVIQDDQNNWSKNPLVNQENEKHIDFSKPINGGPTELGFDYFFGTAGCSTSDPPYCFIEQNRTVDIPSVMSPDSFSKLPGFGPGLMVPGFSLTEVDPVFTEKAIGFIKDHQNKLPGKPFFLYLALSSPHNPFLPPDFAKGKSTEGPRGDLVTVVDWSVGRILEVLKQYGLDKNTLVIVTSDNGAMKGANGHKSNGDYRGYKANIWDGGHRIPFIARWPGKIKPGSESSEVISLTDMFATFSSLVSSKVTEDSGEDSYDVLPAFFGKRQENSDTRVRVFHSGGGYFAVQKGPWKLIEGTKGSGSGVKMLNEGPSVMTGQLYNVMEDPSEKNDLWEKEPGVVNELGAILEKCKSVAATNKIQNFQINE
jgi:arylsulfatase A-like enzyme